MDADYALGYVVGVLKGDGSLFQTRDYYYFGPNHVQVQKAEAIQIVPRLRKTVSLEVTDMDFLTAFRDALEILTDRHPSMRKTGCYRSKFPKYADKMKPLFKLCLRSNVLYDRLLPLRCNLEWLKTASIETKRGFIVGIYDSEGNVQRQKYGGWRIVLYNKNRELLIVCQQILRQFGIEATFEDERDMKGARSSRLRFERREYVRLFADNFKLNIARKKIHLLLPN